MELETIIGLEVHIQLKTKSGLFCRCSVGDDDAAPNTRVCPVCLGMLGALPLLNKKAVEHMITLGLALGCTLASHSKWDRKNYFYPDLPKGYQISQFDLPLCSGGELEAGGKLIRLNRIHLEEDAAKTVHKGDKTLVDFNRSGTALAELVTEPDFRDTDTVKAFLQELRLIARTIGVSDADMEKGQLRVDASISLRPVGEEKLYPRTEIKNLNSFRGVEAALSYELKKQTRAWNDGKPNDGDITVLWDGEKNETRLMRDKENAADYRYFPEPDIPEVELTEKMIAALRESLAELPSDKRARYANDFGIKAEDIESYVTDRELGAFFESVVIALDNDKEKVKLASNYITSDLMSLRIKDEVPQLPEVSSFAKLITMTAAGDLSSRGAKDLLGAIYRTPGDPEVLANEKGLLQKSDEGELADIVETVISENPSVVEEYKGGNEKVLQFLVGQGMKASKGSANPGVLAKLLKESLTK